MVGMSEIANSGAERFPSGLNVVLCERLVMKLSGVEDEGSLHLIALLEFVSYGGRARLPGLFKKMPSW
jgi:hypothetical protein